MIDLRPLRDCVQRFTRLIDTERRDDGALLTKGREFLKDLIATDAWLPEEFAHAHPKRYQQFLLYCDPLERLSMVSFVWGAGQRTPIHDHTVWGLVGVLRGEELSQRYTRQPDGTLVPDGKPLRLRSGEIDTVSPGLGDIHQVANGLPDRPSISIHVYGANIGGVRRHVFDPDTARTRPFVSGYSSALLPNIWDRSLEMHS
jgi:3-mercaptopropionate dioxygenase